MTTSIKSPTKSVQVGQNKQFIQVDVKDLQSKDGQLYVDYEGSLLQISDDVKKDICSYYRVPASLINIDKSHKLNTLQQVLETVTPQISLGVSTSSTPSVEACLDPRSIFISDDEFNSMLQTLSHDFQVISKTNPNSFEQSVKIILDESNSDTFLKDIFNREATFTRLKQGGVRANLALLRLACTNGMMVPDKSFRSESRKKVFDSPFLLNFMSELSALNLSQYLHTLWTDTNGNLFQASVSDFLGMKSTLSSYTDKETADEFFPQEPIESHYLNQNIDINSISSKLKNRLPSGISYYDCFNILTNGIKRSEDQSLQAHVEVGRWANPSTLSQARQTSFQFSGIPIYNPSLISRLKGDS